MATGASDYMGYFHFSSHPISVLDSPRPKHRLNFSVSFSLSAGPAPVWSFLNRSVLDLFFNTY